MFTPAIRMRPHGFASHLEFNKPNGTSPTSMIEFIKIIIMLFLIDLCSAFLQRLSKKPLNRLSEYFSPGNVIYLLHCSWQDVSLVHFLYWWPCTWDDTVISGCDSNQNKLIRNAMGNLTESGACGGKGHSDNIQAKWCKTSCKWKVFFFPPAAAACVFFFFVSVFCFWSFPQLWLFLWRDRMFSIMASALCDSWPVPHFYCYCLINFLISHLLHFLA